MRNLILLIITLQLVLLSCEDDRIPSDCKGFTTEAYKPGQAFATGSYQDLQSSAIFTHARTSDTINGGWIHDKSKKGFKFSVIDEQCTVKSKLLISNVSLNVGDTILLQKYPDGYDRSIPSSSFYILDDDVSFETYKLTNNSNNNWVIIESINSDTTLIKGQFNISLVTTYEDYLSGERERWDDPDRPDTLHFTNGVFTSEFAKF